MSDVDRSFGIVCFLASIILDDMITKIILIIFGLMFFIFAIVDARGEHRLWKAKSRLQQTEFEIVIQRLDIIMGALLIIANKADKKAVNRLLERKFDEIEKEVEKNEAKKKNKQK
jgi:hypothetical protein